MESVKSTKSVSSAKMLWKQRASLKLLQQQLTRAQTNLATVVQAAQDQEDWVRCLTDQPSMVHPETLEENLQKLDKLCALAQRYWIYCMNKSAQVDKTRQECCYYEDLDTTLDLSLDQSLDHSFDRSLDTLDTLDQDAPAAS